MRTPWRALAALLLAAGCGSGGGGFGWKMDLHDLDDALLAVWVGGPDQAIAVGGDGRSGLLIEWDGERWRAPVLPPSATLWWVWSDGTSAIAVGEEATILRRGPGGWTRDPVPAELDPRMIFYGAWGSGADDIWAVAGTFDPNADGAAAIVHWDGTAWTMATEPFIADRPLFKIWGAARDDVWTVGAAGTILHYDGSSWTQVPSGTTARLVAGWGRSSDEVYVVGGDTDGVILRWDGASWSMFDTTDNGLSGVWTAPGRPLYLGGNGGQLFRYDVGSDGRIDRAKLVTAQPTDIDFHAVTGNGTTVVAVGADLLFGGTAGWRGALASHNGSFAGPLELPPTPDAGPPDADVPDADVPDAAPIIDGAIDAVPPDAHWPIGGEHCSGDADGGYTCATGYECWLLWFTGEVICTEPCTNATECTAYGATACCAPPGPQTLLTMCIPGMYQECL